jgi:RNA polymerase sigma-70 factor (ECF subfamily)
LLVITRNVAIDLGKARARRPALVPADESAGVEQASGLSGTDQVLLRLQLHEALASIRAEQRAAVVEIVLKDRSYAEVAADFGIPSGTVKTRVHHGLRRLRCLLEAAEVAA